MSATADNEVLKVSDYRLKSSEQHGKESEGRWARAFPEAVRSSNEEDWYDHIDFWHGPDGVDIKGRKLPEQIWLEFKNVNGNNGWMKGKAKWIAIDFPQITGFIRFDREEALDWIRKDLSEKGFPYTNSSKHTYKKLYTRAKWGKSDLMTSVTIHDLSELPSFLYIPWSEIDIFEANGKKDCVKYVHPQTGKVMVFEVS